MPSSNRARTVSALAICGLVWPRTAAWADEAAHPARASGHGDLQIRIPAVVYAKPLTGPRELAIGVDDLHRRYVDAQGSIVLTSNTASGYRLSVALDPRVLSGAVIRIQGQTLDAREAQTSFHVLAST